jgi:MFS family permease
MFFVFGMSQFMFQTPAGYLMDYSDKKTWLLGAACISTTAFTLITAAFAKNYGSNLGLMVLVKFLQGAVTSLIPPGLNSITQGIVGALGMTHQVSKNEMMNHLGTAIIVLSASMIGFYVYPNVSTMFVVSPIACAGVIFFLSRILPNDIDHNAARGLVPNSEKTKAENLEYVPPKLEEDSSPKEKIQTTPSFTFGFGTNSNQSAGIKSETPLNMLRDPTLLTFIFICFTFHLANGTVLPLVMQTLAISNGRTGLLMSGMCIIIAQVFMVLSAKICGDYSGIYGRKTIYLVGLFSVPIRCLILFTLLNVKGDGDSKFIEFLLLSTQILDGVGAGVFGTMYILVTSDISGGTGRFSLSLGMTAAAQSIGGTVSGYLGQALAQDYGYKAAFVILGFMSLIPSLSYLFFMPETLKTIPSDGKNRLPCITEDAAGEEQESPIKRKLDYNVELV